MRGEAARKYKPIGTERVSREGYRERKIHDGLPLQSRWRAVHLIEWEAVNGALPAGMCLRMVGEDKIDTAPSNWEPISRAVNLYLNSRWVRLKLADAERETRPTLLTAAKLRCRASERRRERKQA